MTEKTIHLVSIQDLKRIRVRCNKCETTFEVSMEKLGPTFSGSPQTMPQCPQCNTDLHHYRGDHNPFWQFEHALRLLAETKAVDVEFVIDKPAAE